MSLSLQFGHTLDATVVKDPKSGAIYYVAKEMRNHPRLDKKRLRP